MESGAESADAGSEQESSASESRGESGYAESGSAFWAVESA